MAFTSTPHILVVDDENSIRTLLSEILEDEGYKTSVAAHSEAALHVLSTHLPNLIILDIWLDNSDMDGMEILAHVKQEYPDIPVLMISGHGNVEMAVNAMKLGAYEFIEKPFNSDHLLLLIERALEANQLRSENLGLKKKASNYEFFTATDPKTIAIKASIEKVAPTHSRVMVSGPSGSGKKLVCHMIRSLSNVANGPMHSLECMSLATEHQDRQKNLIIEAFEASVGGTLILQDVGELPEFSQSFLINILQDKEKSEKIRIISTSNHDHILEQIANGTFKEDLFYRLNIVHIHLPSLKERRQDIAVLSKSFLKDSYAQKGLSAPAISSEAAMLLSSYDWPGNVRQLKNIMEHITIIAMAENTKTITPSHIPADVKMSGLRKDTKDSESSQISGDLIKWLGLPMKDARNCFEKYYLDFQMNRFSGQISKVAHHIGMERTALHRKLKALEDLDYNDLNDRSESLDNPVKQAKG